MKVGTGQLLSFPDLVPQRTCLTCARSVQTPVPAPCASPCPRRQIPNRCVKQRRGLSTSGRRSPSYLDPSPRIGAVRRELQPVGVPARVCVSLSLSLQRTDSPGLAQVWPRRAARNAAAAAAAAGGRTPVGGDAAAGPSWGTAAQQHRA